MPRGLVNNRRTNSTPRIIRRTTRRQEKICYSDSERTGDYHNDDNKYDFSKEKEIEQIRDDYELEKVIEERDTFRKHLEDQIDYSRELYSRVKKKEEELLILKQNRVPKLNLDQNQPVSQIPVVIKKPVKPAKPQNLREKLEIERQRNVERLDRLKMARKKR